jgi:hypothetical protein
VVAPAVEAAALVPEAGAVELGVEEFEPEAALEVEALVPEATHSRAKRRSTVRSMPILETNHQRLRIVEDSDMCMPENRRSEKQRERLLLSDH